MQRDSAPDAERLTRAAWTWLSLDLRRAVDTLSQRQRQAVLLTDILGMTEEEASGIMCVAQKTLEAHKSAGRTKLKILLLSTKGKS